MKVCYITSLLGPNILASQMNMFYMQACYTGYILVTQMYILISNFSWKSNHNKFVGKDMFVY